MLYFSLPNFIENFELNTKFRLLTLEHSEWLKTKLRIVSHYGNLPYSFWGGTINNNKGDLLLYPDIIFKYAYNLGNPLRFNITNTHLTPMDFKDLRLNTILKLCDNGSNLIETNSLDLIKYLKDVGYTYKFIFNDEFINKDAFIDLLAIDNEDILLYNIPKSIVLSPDTLKNLPNRQRLEIALENRTCEKFLKCLTIEHELQYNFYGASVYDKCDKCFSYKAINYSLTLEHIIQDYMPLGIQHYKLPDMIPNIKEKDYYRLFLINYFIKDEFKMTALNYLLEV